MRVCEAHIVGVAPYSQSRPFQPRGDKESPDDHEKRCWSDRIHADEQGNVYIPPMSFKESLAEAARFLGRKIPGKGNATWAKHFKAGVIVTDRIDLGIKKQDVPGEWLYLNADGRKGGCTRVWRRMPLIAEWSVKVTFYVLDDTITAEEFEYTLREAGKFIGIGRFRPQNGGFYGRFDVKKVEWLS